MDQTKPQGGEEDNSYFQLIIILVGMAVSSCITVLIYFAVRRCLSRKIKIGQAQGVKTGETDRGNFNQLNSSIDVDDEVDRIQINQVNERIIDPNGLKVPEHHENMTKEQML